VSIQERFRIGVATDYIHLLGRLMRSDLAAGVYVVRDPVPPELLDDLTFAAHLVADARREVVPGQAKLPLSTLHESKLIFDT